MFLLLNKSLQFCIKTGNKYFKTKSTETKVWKFISHCTLPLSQDKSLIWCNQPNFRGKPYSVIQNERLEPGPVITRCTLVLSIKGWANGIWMGKELFFVYNCKEHDSRVWVEKNLIINETCVFAVFKDISFIQYIL